jgi:hypothetical protein
MKQHVTMNDMGECVTVSECVTIDDVREFVTMDDVKQIKCTKHTEKDINKQKNTNKKNSKMSSFFIPVFWLRELDCINEELSKHVLATNSSKAAETNVTLSNQTTYRLMSSLLLSTIRSNDIRDILHITDERYLLVSPSVAGDSTPIHAVVVDQENSHSLAYVHFHHGSGLIGNVNNSQVDVASVVKYVVDSPNHNSTTPIIIVTNYAVTDASHAGVYFFVVQ